MSEKHLYTNHVETFVAHSLDEVRSLYESHYGETMESATCDDREIESWGQVDDDEEVEIYWPNEAEGLQTTCIEHDVESPFDDGNFLLIAPAGEWARWHAPGFLCSTEY